MPKRTVEQVIQAEWKAALEAERAAKNRLEALEKARTNAAKAHQAQEVLVREAADRVSRALASLEAYLGKKIPKEEVQNGESPAPADGASDEVLERKDVEK